MHDAKLIWVTPDAEQLIGKIARVSNPKNEDNPNVEGLLNTSSSTSTGHPLRWQVCASKSIQQELLAHKSCVIVASRSKSSPNGMQFQLIHLQQSFPNSEDKT